MTCAPEVSRLNPLLAAVALCLVHLQAQIAAAQEQPPAAQPAQPPPGQPQQPGPSQPEPPAQPGQAPQETQPPEGAPGRTEVQGEPVPVEDHMQQRPKPPDSDVFVGEHDDATVGLGAGVGGPLAYASETVVELGGTMAITHASDTTTVRFSPLIGYFFVDNFELTLLVDLIVTDVGDESDASIGAVLEPSYHTPLDDMLLLFGGLGLGLKYAEDPGADFFLRPRIGFDVLVGRSGILKPALFLDIGVNDGLTAGGLEAAFTVML
jgi:hypothetical protein